MVTCKAKAITFMHLTNKQIPALVYSALPENAYW